MSSAGLPASDGARLDGAIRQLKFRDPALARGLAETIARVTKEIGRSPVSVMHVWVRNVESNAGVGWLKRFADVRKATREQ